MNARPAVDHWNAADWDKAVAGFLRANPDWLREHPDLYRALTPPLRVHGDTLADHMAAMVLSGRRHAAALEEQTRRLIAAKRAANTGLNRVHEAVLALMAAEDAQEFVTTDLARLLGADVARLWVCSAPGEDLIDRLDALLGSRDVVFRAAPDDAADLYGEAEALALHDVLIRLPGGGVLALASRDDLCLAPTQTRASLQFLAQAIAQALLR